MSTMRIAMLSQDVHILDEGSAVSTRIASYGALADEVDFIVFGVGARREVRLAPNVWACAPGGVNKIHALFLGYRELASLLVKKTYQLVSTQDPFFIGAVGFLLARKHTIPLQVQLHTDCFSRNFIGFSPRRLVEVTLALFIIRGASCVRVVSERIARHIRHLTHAPVAVLPIRVSSDIGMPNREARHQGTTLHLLAVSRLTPEKRVYLILDALARVHTVELTVVGDGPLKDMLEMRAKKLKIKNRVRFVGWQDPEAYYQKADAFVQMSTFEGYGMTLVEASLHALPIITTDVGIVGDLLRAGSEALVVPASVDALRRAIERLRADGAYATMLGNNAKKRVGGAQLSEAEYLARYKEVIHTCTI